jgi:hypothetical protein
MAQIGYGYGSEFQLLRFLGHHRNILEEKLREAIGISDGNFYWFDFDFADREKIISGDSEMCGLSFLEKKIPNISTVCNEIKKYPWSFDRWQYWDAVFILDNVLYFVEAKAHKDELKSGNKVHGGTHSKEILAFMKSQFNCANENWLRDYYQFANRLSTISFLNSKDVICKLVNLYFVDGYYDRERGINKDTKEDSFRNEIKQELKTLGIGEEQNKYVIDVFIDANP